MSEVKWEPVKPEVNAEAEFFEILNDFGDPLEVLREAISNAFDAYATKTRISFDVETIEGRKKLVISLEDNGSGMTFDVLKRDFWGLGYSPSRERDDAIGEKGHGTKIYLRSEKIIVKTQSKEGTYQAECENPLATLSSKKLHQPRIAKIEPFLPAGQTGTIIRIEGYNDSERSKFKQDFVGDYILWFTKLGSIEREFGDDKYKNIQIELKCLDKNEFEIIQFGHLFPKVNSDINKLLDDYGLDAADLYVKKHLWKEQRLQSYPEVTYDVVVYIEGDQAKRSYNPMIKVTSFSYCVQLE